MLRIRTTVTAVLALAAVTAACPVASAHEVPPGGVLTHGPDPEPPPSEITASLARTASLTATRRRRSRAPGTARPASASR